MQATSKNKQLFIVTLILIFLNVFFFLLAMLIYPGYNQFEQTISKLVTKWPAALFFNIALVFGILSSIIVVYIFNKELQTINTVKNNQRLLILIVFALIPVFMLGVLVFPSMGDTSDVHDFFAVLLFIFMGIGTSILSRILSTHIEAWKKSITYLGYSIPVLVVILGYLLSFAEYGPIVQKITVLLFDTWCLWTINDLFQRV
ncbi:MAG: DUF998 domain-containing protein [Candidatus Hodarchaeales archaeon]